MCSIDARNVIFYFRNGAVVSSEENHGFLASKIWVYEAFFLFYSPILVGFLTGCSINLFYGRLQKIVMIDGAITF